MKKKIVIIFSMLTMVALVGCLVQKQMNQTEQSEPMQYYSTTPTSTSIPTPTSTSIPTPTSTSIPTPTSTSIPTPTIFQENLSASTEKIPEITDTEYFIELFKTFKGYDQFNDEQIRLIIESKDFETHYNWGKMICDVEGTLEKEFSGQENINYLLQIIPELNVYVEPTNTPTPNLTSTPILSPTSTKTPELTKSKLTKDDFGYSSSGKFEYSENLIQFVKNLEGYDQFNDMQIQIIIESREFEFRFNRGLELGYLDKYLEMNLGGEENIKRLKSVEPIIDYYTEYQEKPTSTPIPTIKPTSKPTPKPTKKPTPKPTKKPENKGMTASETNLVFTSLETKTITITVDSELYKTNRVYLDESPDNKVVTACVDHYDKNPFDVEITPVFNGKTILKFYYDETAWIYVNITVDVDELNNLPDYELTAGDIKISESKIIIREDKPYTLYMECNTNCYISGINQNYCSTEMIQNGNRVAYTFFPRRNSEHELDIEYKDGSGDFITIPVIIDVRPEDKLTASKTVPLKDAYIGSTVLFGSYEQDNNLENGTEDVEWLVLDIKDGKALLISKYAIMREKLSNDPALNNRYSYTDDYVSATNSSKYNNLFKGISFTDIEKCSICSVNTDDSQYIFNLSKSEVEQYFNEEFLVDEFGDSILKRTTTATDYVKAQGIAEEDSLTSGGLGNVRWMASDGYVWYDGSLDKEPNLEPGFIGTKGDSTLVWGYPTATIGIRPAMWVSLSISTSSTAETSNPTPKPTQSTANQPKSSKATLDTYTVTTAEGEKITLENVTGEYLKGDDNKSYFVADGLGKTFQTVKLNSEYELWAWADAYPEASYDYTYDAEGNITGGVIYIRDLTKSGDSVFDLILRGH